MTLQNTMIQLAQKAKAASLKLARASTESKNRALILMADELVSQSDFLIRENAKDLAAAQREGLSKPMIERLTLGHRQIEEMAESLRATSKLIDPIGEVIKTFKRPNGLLIKKVRVPIGVIAIIYESRPNVTSDCIGLCLKSGNAAILKGGREAIHSNKSIFKLLKGILKTTEIPAEVIGLVESTDRKAVDTLLELDQLIDVVIPRGGETLIRLVAEKSRIPVIKHFKGLCHVYVSDKADMAMARNICFNAKVQKPGVCNAMESMLVHKNIAEKFLPLMIEEFQNAGVEIRGCPQTRKIVKGKVKVAKSQDWETEFLDLILAVKVVNDTAEAIDHINIHGSHHSDAIVTNDNREAEGFLSSVDSACLYVNASTRFTDGYQFGFGAEIGISTDKLHARGPMALEELTTYKYCVYGQGQIRP